MASKQSLLGLVDTSRQVRRAPLVGMEFLHQGTMRAADVAPARSRLQAKDLVSLLVRHFSARKRALLAPTRITLHVVTPAGKPAVKIRFQ